MASDLLLLNNSSSSIGSALHSPRIASMQNLIPRMALTYAQLISPYNIQIFLNCCHWKNIIIFTIVNYLLAKNSGNMISCFHENVSPQFLLVYFPQLLHNTINKLKQALFFFFIGIFTCNGEQVSYNIS